jgi:hypothetical protein
MRTPPPTVFESTSFNVVAGGLTVPRALTMNYVGSLLKTRGARSRLEATLVALRDGVVSLDLD